MWILYVKTSLLHTLISKLVDEEFTYTSYATSPKFDSRYGGEIFLLRLFIFENAKSFHTSTTQNGGNHVSSSAVHSLNHDITAVSEYVQSKLHQIKKKKTVKIPMCAFYETYLFTNKRQLSRLQQPHFIVNINENK
jgi:hypothetical protein